MHSLPDIVRRHFEPTLAMLRELIETCPEEVFASSMLGEREHLYHAMVGMDVWLSPDPMKFPFDHIIDDDAAECRAPASERISRAYLMDYLARLEAKIADLPVEPDAYLTVAVLRGREFTLLDRCLTQLRHVQHHIGVVNEKLRARGATAAGWQGYGEG